MTARPMEQGFPAEGSIFAVDRIALDILTGEHPWVTANRAAIGEQWKTERAANPALFDGQMVLARRVLFEQGRIDGRTFMGPFSAFFHWRPGRPDGLTQLFAMPVITSADGAPIAIRMTDTTANPGKIYFDAGSLDAGDVVNGRCDLAGNMGCEVLEETGLDLRLAKARELFSGCMSTTPSLSSRFSVSIKVPRRLPPRSNGMSQATLILRSPAR